MKKEKKHKKDKTKKAPSITPPINHETSEDEIEDVNDDENLEETGDEHDNENEEEEKNKDHLEDSQSKPIQTPPEKEDNGMSAEDTDDKDEDDEIDPPGALMDILKGSITSLYKDCTPKEQNGKKWRTVLTQVKKVELSISKTEENQTEKINKIYEMMKVLLKHTEHITTSFPTTKKVKNLIDEATRTTAGNIEDLQNQLQETKGHIVQLKTKIQESTPPNIDRNLIEELKEQHHEVIQHLPTSVQIDQQNTMLTTLAQEVKETTTQLTSLHQLHTAPSTHTEEHNPRQPTTTDNKRQVDKPIQIKPTKECTLLVKAKGPDRMLGAEIYRHLSKIPTDHIDIEKTNIQRFHFEIHCHSTQDVEALQRKYTSIESLNKNLTFTTRTPELQRCIIMGVPEHVDEESLLQSTARQFKIHLDEFKIVRRLKAKTEGQSNWIVYMLPGLLRLIIKDQGLLVGTTTCPTRPHTLIQRCRRCQSLKHTEKFCNLEQVCENCGRNHEDQNCTLPPQCHNCRISNIRHKTNYSTSHKTSVPVCPAYRDAYTAERERLDAKFMPGYTEREKQHPSNTAQNTTPQQIQSKETQRNSSGPPPAPPAANAPAPPQTQPQRQQQEQPPEPQEGRKQQQHNQQQRPQQQNHQQLAQRPQAQASQIHPPPQRVSSQGLRPYSSVIQEQQQTPRPNYTALPRRPSPHRLPQPELLQEFLLPAYQTYAQPRPQDFPSYRLPDMPWQSSFPFSGNNSGYYK